MFWRAGRKPCSWPPIGELGYTLGAFFLICMRVLESTGVDVYLVVSTTYEILGRTEEFRQYSLVSSMPSLRTSYLNMHRLPPALLLSFYVQSSPGRKYLKLRSRIYQPHTHLVNRLVRR